MNPAAPAAVLDFWFGPPPWAQREAWFRKDPAFDETVRARFGVTLEAAVAGALAPEWNDSPAARLAQLIVLDQFTRNAFRDNARAFAGDALALALARGMLAAGEDAQMPPLARWFIYLPLEHAEDLVAQDHCVQLFEALAAAEPALAGALDYAHRHREVIRRFGRFPHRNRALGRADTPAESDYLAQPGAGF